MQYQLPYQYRYVDDTSVWDLQYIYAYSYIVCIVQVQVLQYSLYIPIVDYMRITVFQSKKYMYWSYAGFGKMIP